MEASADIAAYAKDPAKRQVLVNIGNRYVVFGLSKALPDHPILGPENVHRRFSERVGDEYDFPHDRLIQSIQLNEGEVVVLNGPDEGWDLKLQYPDGSKTLVQIKIRTRPFLNRESEEYFELLKEMRVKKGVEAEVWNFNIERLRLTIMASNSAGIPQFHEMDPLNIWEFNSDGTAFERSRIVERVSDWISRVSAVYSNVEEWSNGLGVEIDKSRTILMSEQLMQMFFVPDKEVPVLDLSKDGKYLLSFVPVGLWVIGSNGRIDVISKQGTFLLLDSSYPPEPPNWSLRDRKLRTFEIWDRTSFTKLAKLAEAP